MEIISEMSLNYLRRLHAGFSLAVSVTQLAPCYGFSGSKEIDHLFAGLPTTESFPNPWHVGTLDSQTYPDPNSLMQSELELLVFLFSTVLETKPRLVFESGTNIGLGARAMGAGCWTNGFGRVVTCDTDARMVEYARKVCEGIPVDVQHSAALDMPELGEADLVFIDSDYKSRVQEISRVKSGALIILHDTMGELWLREIVDEERYRVHVDGPRGFSIMRKQ